MLARRGESENDGFRKSRFAPDVFELVVRFVADRVPYRRNILSEKRRARAFRPYRRAIEYASSYTSRRRMVRYVRYIFDAGFS